MSDIVFELSESVAECTSRLDYAIDWFGSDVGSVAALEVDGAVWAYQIRSVRYDTLRPWVVGVSLFDHGAVRRVHLAAHGYGGIWGMIAGLFDASNTPRLSKSIKRMEQIAHLLKGGQLGAFTNSLK